MLRLLLIWPFLFLLLLGCGLLAVATLERMGGRSFRAPVPTFQAFWLGYAGVIAFLQLYSLLLPTRIATLLALAGLAVAGFVVQRKAVLARLRATRRAQAWVMLALIVVTALVVMVHAAQPVGWYDTHLYHLQVVQWARTYAAVPGIANLHYRLAFDNSVHLFAALVDVLWSGRAAYLTLGFMTTVLIVQLLGCTLRATHARARNAAAFALLVLPFLLGRLQASEVNSLSTDLPLALLCIVVALELLQLRSPSRAHVDLQLATVLALSAVATTTKLGGLGVLLTSSGLVLVSLYRRGLASRRTLLVLAPAMLVLLGYFARQLVLSGWLLFPAPFGNLHLSWSLPEAQTLDQFRWIKSWARLPGREPAEVLDHGFLHWFRPWFEGFKGSHELVLLQVCVVLAIARLGRGGARRVGAQRAAMASAALSLLLWFQGAPDLRFGAVFFWMLLAALAAAPLGEALRQPAGRALGLAAAILLTHWTGGMRMELFVPKSFWRLPPVKAVGPVHEVETSPGLTVSVPAPEDDRCSNVPLPCTPYPERQKLRRPGDLSAGFIY